MDYKKKYLKYKLKYLNVKKLYGGMNASVEQHKECAMCRHCFPLDLFDGTKKTCKKCLQVYVRKRAADKSKLDEAKRLRDQLSGWQVDELPRIPVPLSRPTQPRRHGSVPEGHKQCGMCHRHLPPDDFNGINKTCKVCLEQAKQKRIRKQCNLESLEELRKKKKNNTSTRGHQRLRIHR